MHSLGILLSGRRSNFVAIVDSIDAGRIPDAQIAVVISNKADAPGVATARARGLNTLVIPSKGKPREEHDREVVAALKQNGVELVCLAGYIDRKSTRLNSSHRCISYAVFCLKKKKK